MRPDAKYDNVQQARDYLLDKIGGVPKVAVVMGSGLSAMEEIVPGADRLHYMSIPNFPVPKVQGHRGQVVYGKTGDKFVAMFEGRIHYYEGYSMNEVTFAARVIGSMGVETLILTNAAGAINTNFERGQLMLISDHINLIGRSPLRGPNEDRWGPRFVDQTEVYSADLRNKLRLAAAENGITVQEGVYAAMAGPQYETPAEIRFLRTIGADCVGMSTVPEAIVARHMGVKVAGISMLSNLAAGMSGKPLSHEEVLQSGAQLHGDVGLILQRFLEKYA